jgi:hypothetical protein
MFRTNTTLATWQRCMHHRGNISLNAALTTTTRPVPTLRHGSIGSLQQTCFGLRTRHLHAVIRSVALQPEQRKDDIRILNLLKWGTTASAEQHMGRKQAFITTSVDGSHCARGSCPAWLLDVPVQTLVFVSAGTVDIVAIDHLAVVF